MKQFFWLVAIAISLPTAAIVPEGAILQGRGYANAAPQACLDVETLRMAKIGSPYMLFDRGNSQTGSVNVREQPSAQAKLLRAAQSRNPAEVLEQVTGKDEFCWLRVRVVYSFQGGSAATVTGWVRGDLVIPALDP
jgi:Bacterial SH3 domain